MLIFGKIGNVQSNNVRIFKRFSRSVYSKLKREASSVFGLTSVANIFISKAEAIFITF